MKRSLAWAADPLATLGLYIGLSTAGRRFWTLLARPDAEVFQQILTDPWQIAVGVLGAAQVMACLKSNAWGQRVTAQLGFIGALGVSLAFAMTPGGFRSAGWVAWAIVAIGQFWIASHWRTREHLYERAS